MEALTIKTPADVQSFVGHTLGFWPHESLVCIALDENYNIAVTRRVDVPQTNHGLFAYARTVAGYLTSDRNAATVLFAVYTSKPPEPGQEKPHAGTIAAGLSSMIDAELVLRGSRIPHSLTLALPDP